MKTSVSSLLALFCVATVPSLTANEVVFTETFPRSTADVASVNWQTFNSANATNQSANTNFASGFVISSSTGMGGEGNYLVTSFKGVGLTFTDKFDAIDRSITEIATLSFATSNNNTTDSYRFAIQLDLGGTTAWYATDAVFRQATAGGTVFNNTGETKSFTFTTDASAWRELTFTPGSTLSLAGSSIVNDLPMGSLMAAGIYNDSNDDVLRWDHFEIAVIPEPAVFGALLGLAGLSLCLLRRKRGGFTGGE